MSGILNSILKTRDAAAMKEVRGWLWKLHRGLLDADGKIRLANAAQQLQLSEKDLAREQADVVAQKDREKAEKQAVEAPPFTDEREPLFPIVYIEPFLVFGPSPIVNQLRLDLVLTGGVPLPDKYCICPHRPPGVDEAEFGRWKELLRAVIRGELVPGRCAALLTRQAVPPTDMKPWDPEYPPSSIATQRKEWSFIRLPGQSQADFDKALATLDETLDKSEPQFTSTRFRPVAAEAGHRKW